MKKNTYINKDLKNILKILKFENFQEFQIFERYDNKLCEQKGKGFQKQHVAVKMGATEIAVEITRTLKVSKK